VPLGRPNGKPIGLKLNGTQQILVDADDVSLLENKISTTKKNKEALTNSSREFGLEVSTKVTKYTLKSRDQKAGQNHG
jgi:hypothetical protein